MRDLRQDEVKKLHQIAADKGLVNLRACVYARKSREDKSNTSLSVQVNECKSFVNRYPTLMHLNDDAIYQEDNVSGMYLDHRKAFESMIEAIKKNRYDVVLVSKFDRFSRDIANMTTMLSEFERLGVYLIAGDDLGDTSAAGMLIKQIYWATNEFHVRRSTEDIMKTHANLVKSGKTVGGPGNFGYNVKNRKYVINPEEAIAVNMIFDMFLDGKSYSDIAFILDQKGYKPRHSKRFAPSFIHSVLTNPRNCGKSVWNSREKRKRKRRVLREVMDEVVSEDVVEEPIISKEKFDQVQRILNQRTYGKHNKKGKSYTLTGIIKCNECGGAMTGNSQRSGRNKTLYRTYHCKNHKKKHGGTCSTKPVRLEYIEHFIKRIILDRLNATLPTNPINKQGIKVFLKDEKTILNRLDREIKKDEESLSQMTRGLYSITEEIIQKKTKEEIVKVSDKIDKASLQKATIQRRIESFNVNPTMFNEGRLNMNTLFVDEGLTRQLIRSMIKEVKITNDAVEIEFFQV